MGFNLQVVKTNDFVRFDGHGKLDLEQSRRALERLATACVTSGANCALLDVRDMRTELGLVDFYNLISAFHAMGFRHNHHLAVLHRYNGGDKAEFFALCASSRGWNVRAFDEFEHAVEWFESSCEVK